MNTVGVSSQCQMPYEISEEVATLMAAFDDAGVPEACAAAQGRSYVDSRAGGCVGALSRGLPVGIRGGASAVREAQVNAVAATMIASTIPSDMETTRMRPQLPSRRPPQARLSSRSPRNIGGATKSLSPEATTRAHLNRQRPHAATETTPTATLAR